MQPLKNKHHDIGMTVGEEYIAIACLFLFWYLRTLILYFSVYGLLQLISQQIFFQVPWISDRFVAIIRSFAISYVIKVSQSDRNLTYFVVPPIRVFAYRPVYA